MPPKYARKKRTSRYKGSSRAMYKNTKTGTHVELLNIRSLKPKSVMVKLQYYQTMEVLNTLIGNQQNCQFITLNLNSLWILNDTTNAANAGNVWSFNTPTTVHANGASVDSGTAYPGAFNGAGSPGYGYQNGAIIGSKVTISASPLQNTGGGTGLTGPTALFAVVQSQPNTTLSQTTKIEDIYSTPYANVKKLVGVNNTSGLNGSSKSARIVVKYSPKRFNNIKDIRDNKSYFCSMISTAGNVTGNHPGEKDRLSFGLVNILSDPISKQPCSQTLIQIRMECMVLFTEPFENDNFANPTAAGVSTGTQAGSGRVIQVVGGEYV